MLHALLNEHGMGERDKGLDFISLTLMRDVDTTKTLSKADASVVIDRLMAMPKTGTPEPEFEDGDWSEVGA